MYDRKVVRRRRAALAVFVALSIAILTAYFGESGGGLFHTLQRGAQQAFAPVETGASRALKPPRDFVGWVGDTIDAKDQNKDLKKEVERLRTRLAEAETGLRDSKELDALLAKSLRTGGAQQQAVVKEALTLVANNSGEVIPAYRDYIWVSKKRVSGLAFTPNALLDFRKVSLA